MLKATQKTYLGKLSSANDYLVIPVKDFKNYSFSLVASWSASCTVKFYQSWNNSWTAPDLSAAATEINHYDTVLATKITDGATVSWATGVVYWWASDWISCYKLWLDMTQYIGIKMTAFAAWAVNVYVLLSDNQ